MPELEVQLLPSLTEVSPADWDALYPGDYPFIQHRFLLALEQSASVGDDSGWQPAHAVVREAGRVIGALPLYGKSHSYGEYVFDWGWADAFERAGGRYYPKLIAAIPFTPATGPRLGALAGRENEVAAALDTRLAGLLAGGAASGVHILFPQHDSAEHWPHQRYLSRWGCQFHWFDQGFGDFDGFLASFASRKRKNISRERQKVAAAGLELQAATGTELTPGDWREFYSLYQLTYLKRSGHGGYLTEAFFIALGQIMPEQLLLVSAFHQGRRVAAALYLFDSRTLYGRYWGAEAEFDGLHFECCYYQGIEFALRRGLTRFDPGAQGEHKIQRGFTPVLTHSLHWLQNPSLHHAVAEFVHQERLQTRAYLDDARSYLPFRQGFVPVAPDCLIGGAEP